jgi:hypothetical protein
MCRGNESMKTMKLGVLLLAFLLAAMVMVPMVNAANADEQIRGKIIENNYISPDTARTSALNVMQQFVTSKALDGNWNNATINSEPTVIFDVNGKRLFYLYSVEKNGKKIGEIQAAASKALGGSVVTIGATPYLDILDKTMTKSKSATEDQYKDFKIIDQKIVSYNYPKLGVLIRLSNPITHETKELLYDASDFHVVSASDTHSFYSDIPVTEMSARVSRWNTENTNNLKNSISVSSTAVTTTYRISGFTLYPQINDNWCALATAQMISKYWNVVRTQPGIATTVNIGPTEGINYTEMLPKYYQKAQSSGGLGKTGSTPVKGGPTTLFTTIKTEVDANRPVAISTITHTRAVAGWQITTGSPDSHYFYMYDPWPANYGAIYMENFESARNSYVGSILVKN